MHWRFDSNDAGKLRFLVRDDSGYRPLPALSDPATALPLTDRYGGKWIVTLSEPRALFCFAGVWRQASDDRPAFYAAVTVAAYPDLKSIKRRHIAIVPQSSRAAWLAGTGPNSILTRLPAGLLRVLRV